MKNLFYRVVMLFFGRGNQGMILTSPISPRLSAVAKRICEQCDWNVSNLRLQKLIYIAHMLYLGETKTPLIEEGFEAWMYGPVIPKLYHKMKIYGAEPVGDRFHECEVLGSKEIETIDMVCKRLKNASGGKLIAITHADNGAWANSYRAGIKGVKIENQDILNEYESLG